MKKIDLFLIAISVFLAFLFIYYPEIDIKFSSIFYKNGFYLKDSFIAKSIYKATLIIITLFATLTLLLLIFDLVFKRDFFDIKKRVLIYLLTTLILGPGLIVNIFLKDSFKRARPYQIKEFGGDKKFTPAFVLSNQCKKNCSFTSGHAAAAFYFLALVPLFKKRETKILVAFLSILWGSLVGIVRIIQGGHFLSDVIFSAFIVYFIAKICYKILFRETDGKTV